MKYAALAILVAAFAGLFAFGKDKPPLSYGQATLLGFETISTGSRSDVTHNTYTLGGKVFDNGDDVRTVNYRVRVYRLQIGDVVYSVSGNKTLKDHTVGDVISASIDEKEKTLYVSGKNGKPDKCQIVGEMKVPASEKKN
jgi:hypothetical protein